MAPELLVVDDDSQTIPTTEMDVYSFGRIMLQVCDPCVHFRRYDSAMTHWNNWKILTGNIPYHYLSRDEQVLVAIVQGKPPKRPDDAVVTDHRWEFMEWCWSPAKGAVRRPSSDEVVEFTEKDLFGIMATET